MKIKISIFLIIFVSNIGFMFAFDARPFVVNEIHDGHITVSDMQTTLISNKIEKSSIQGQIPDIEAGVIVMLSCTTDRKIIMNNANQEQVEFFNSNFENLLNFFVGYDDKFKKKVIEKYRNGPGENYILKALLLNSLAGAQSSNIVAGNSRGNIENLNQHCFTKANRIGELGRDAFYLTTIAKDIVSGTNIVSRSQRGANQSISMPRPPSTTPTQGQDDSSPAHRPSNSNVILDNYNKNFLAQDSLKIVRHSFDGQKRPLEHFPADRIIIHHTAGSYAPTKQDGINYMKSLQTYHGSRLGWGDIGYHFLIDGEGNIYEGRRGGMHTVGAHVLGHNRGSIGISLMSDGYYSRDMLLALIDLIIYLGQEYQIDVGGNAVFRKSNLDGIESGPVLVAHKELTPSKPYDPMIPMDMFRRIVTSINNRGSFLTNSIK